jgi:DNA polymerase-3 subunit epsilon
MTLPSADLEHAARLLEAHPNFRMLRRLRAVDRLYNGSILGDMRVGVAIDVETISPKNRQFAS